MNFDIAINCGYLLSLKGGDLTPARDQLVGITGSKISYVGPQVTYKAKRTIDAGSRIVMPGLINAHCHLPMTLFRGMAEDLPLKEWLFSHVLPLEGRVVSPEFVRTGTRLACLELILSGTTTVADMYYFEDAIAEVVDASGLRAVLGQSFLDFPTPDCKAKDGSDMRLAEKLVARYKNHERITPCLAPHAPYSCSDETLKKLLAFARKEHVPLMIHVAETRGEVEESLKQYKKTPVARLHDLGLMDFEIAGRPALFAHGVHLSDEDIKTIAKDRAAVVYNPESNMKLGSGAAPVRKLLDAGAIVAIGTDGTASNNDLNLFKEMDSGAKLQKLVNADNAVISSREILRMATIEGARALGLDKVTGSLEEGKYADLIVIDPEVANMQPLHDIPSQLVYASNGTEVQTVICHGRILMLDRHPTGPKPSEIFEDVRQLRQRLKF